MSLCKKTKRNYKTLIYVIRKFRKWFKYNIFKEFTHF